MSSINGTNIERMRVNNNEIALAKINGNVVFQKKKLIKTFYGDSRQETTTGKNLFNYSYYYDNYIPPENGNIGRLLYTLKPNTDYTISTNRNSTTANTTACIFSWSGSEIQKKYISTKNEGILSTSPRTITTDDNGNLVFGLYISGDFKVEESEFESGETWIQIEEGSTATEYEPYTGGIPSPNPDYPQQIKSITGASLKLTGKNLYDNEYTNNIVSNEGVITPNPNWNMSDYIEVESNKSYTFSHNDNNSTGQSLMIIEFDENKNFIKRNSQGNYNYEIYEPYTITTNSSTKFLVLNYNNTYNNNLFQLEKGSQATNYEQYKAQTIPINLQGNILAKVGDYADELQIYSNGDVKLIKKIREYKMTGNENVSNMHTGNLFDYQLFFNNKPYIVGYGLSNYYKYNPVQSGINPATVHGEFVLQHWSDGIDNNYNLLIKDTNHDNITNFKNHLAELYNAETPVKIYYPLVNSTTIKVDNIKEELNSFGDYSNIEIETTYN